MTSAPQSTAYVGVYDICVVVYGVCVVDYDVRVIVYGIFVVVYDICVMVHDVCAVVYDICVIVYDRCSSLKQPRGPYTDVARPEPLNGQRILKGHLDCPPLLSAPLVALVPDVCHFGGLGGPGGLGCHFARRGGLAPTFLKGLRGPRGPTDPQNDQFPTIRKVIFLMGP